MNTHRRLTAATTARAALSILLLAGLAVAPLSGCSDDGGGNDDKDAGVADVAVDEDATDSEDALQGGDTPPSEDVGYIIPEHEFGEGVARPRLQKDAASGEIKAGVAMVWSDGPVGVSMAGYGGRGGFQTPWSDVLKGSKGFYGRSTIKALVIEVDGERLAIVKSPLMCGESYVTATIARKLKESHGIDMTGRIITSAGHSHHNTARYWPLPPSLGAVGIDSFDAEVAEIIGGLFADAIKAAIDDLGPAEWAFEAIEDWDPDDEVYRDRRGENNPTYGKDPRVSLLGVRRPDGEPMALMMNFPIHGTVFGPDNDLLTEDAPGYVERKVEEHFFATYGKSVFGMYMQSAGGDASPAGDKLGHPALARLERIGAFAAPPIVAAWESMSWRKTAELAVRSRLLEVKHDRLYKGTDLDGEFSGINDVPYEWGGWQCFGKGVAEGESSQGATKLCTDIETLLGALGEEMPHSEVHQAYLTVAQLSEVFFLTLPGEPTWSLVKYARDEMAKRQWKGQEISTVVFGYSQDHFLYLTAPDDWFVGGYESTMSLWGPAGGRWFVDRDLEIADDLIEGYGAPTYYEETPYLATPPAFEPRLREASLSAGKLHKGPEASYRRGESVNVRFGAGDPAVGAPLVILQRDNGGGFDNVPSPTGWAGAWYGNSSYAFITLYDPTPEVTPELLPNRKHDWEVIWQVPADLPLGNYRLQISGEALGSSGALKPYEIVTTPFAVAPADGQGVDAAPTTDGSGLVVALTMPGGAEQGSGEGSWPSARYRLIDPMVAHSDTQRVPAALDVVVEGASGEVAKVEGGAWDATLRGVVVPFTGDAPSGTVTVRASVAGDAAGLPAASTEITL